MSIQTIAKNYPVEWGIFLGGLTSLGAVFIGLGLATW